MNPLLGFNHTRKCRRLVRSCLINGGEKTRNQDPVEGKLRQESTKGLNQSITNPPA